MKHAIEEFLKSKRIAIVGISRAGKKFGNAAFKELASRGYEVFAVHPEANEIGGVPCSPSISALREKIDAVLVSIPPAGVPQVLREAAATGVRNVWLQSGAESPGAIALGGELGLNVVSGKCILMYAPPVGGFHKWHRGFNRLIGRL